VLDLYWHFLEPGDHVYLGQVLAFLQPNTPDFATLPPHFKLDEPMSNAVIKEGMLLCFAPILQKWQGTRVDPTGLLLRCLATMVWHSPFLMATIVKYPGHPFAALPLLNNCDLLCQLKDLVTLDPVGHIKNATGIPPHIEQGLLTCKVLDTCIDTLNEVRTMMQDVKVSIGDAIEQKEIENGHLIFDRLRGMFDAHSQSMEKKIEDAIDKLTASFAGRGGRQDDASNNNNDNVVPFADGSEEEIRVVNRMGNKTHTRHFLTLMMADSIGTFQNALNFLQDARSTLDGSFGCKVFRIIKFWVLTGFCKQLRSDLSGSSTQLTYLKRSRRHSSSIGSRSLNCLKRLQVYLLLTIQQTLMQLTLTNLLQKQKII